MAPWWHIAWYVLHIFGIYGNSGIKFSIVGIYRMDLWHTKFSPHALIWWRHQMETFSALLALCARNSPVPVNSPHKGQWRGTLMLSLICTRTNDWVNNCEAGDLRRNRGHYDVIVMTHWDKMADISHPIFSKSFSGMTNLWTLINISLKLVS